MKKAPVGERIVKRANQSVREFSSIFSALELDGKYSIETMQKSINALSESNEKGALKRRNLRSAIEYKAYEFAALGVERMYGIIHLQLLRQNIIVKIK